MAAQWNEIPVPTGKEALSRTYPAGYRSDVIEVPIEAGDRGLEYMIRMKAGDTVVYNDGTHIQAAAALAKQSKVAVVYAGYVESEGTDRSDLGYDNGVCELTCVTQPANSDALIAAVAKANEDAVNRQLGRR